MSPAPKSYLEKAGLTKGNLYLLGVLLSGGGYEHFTKSDEISSMRTEVALLSQRQQESERKLTDVDKDLRLLTRQIDRMPQGRAIAALP